MTENRDTLLNSSQLYLIVDAVSGHSGEARLRAALGATKIASVLITGDKLDAASARPLVELIQSFDVAALIDTDAALARALRADGVHLRSGPQLEAAFTEAREVLGTRYIIGGEAGTRHDAMWLGEAGAEYVAFPPGADQAEFVAWWAEIFELPCVAFDVADLAEASGFAIEGADFVAVRLPSTGSPADIQQFVQASAAAIHRPQAAAS